MILSHIRQTNTLKYYIEKKYTSAQTQENNRHQAIL